VVYTYVLFEHFNIFLFMYRKADDGLQKVSQTGQDLNVKSKDFTNKHIMAYSKYSVLFIST